MILSSVILLLSYTYKKFMFVDVELMFSVVELVFGIVELMFNVAEHKIYRGM